MSLGCSRFPLVVGALWAVLSEVRIFCVIRVICVIRASDLRFWVTQRVRACVIGCVRSGHAA